MHNPTVLLSQIIGKTGLFLLKILKDCSPDSQDGKLDPTVKICKAIGSESRSRSWKVADNLTHGTCNRL